MVLGLTEGLGECIPLVSFTDSQYGTGSHLGSGCVYFQVHVITLPVAA